MGRRQERIAFFHRAMENLGISFEDRLALRRIELTLHRWAELECGDSNDYGSWTIERDETTDKPYMVHHHYRHGQGKDSTSTTLIADREKGALKRTENIMSRYPTLTWYHQTDPRGCALYILRKQDVKDVDVSSCYNRGVAVTWD